MKWTDTSTSTWSMSGVTYYRFGPDAKSYKLKGKAGYVKIDGKGLCPISKTSALFFDKIWKLIIDEHIELPSVAFNVREFF